MHRLNSTLALVAALAVALFSACTPAPKEMSVIPLPSQLTLTEGSFNLSRQLSVGLPEGADSLQKVVKLFAYPLQHVSGKAIRYTGPNDGNINVNINPELAPEAYTLDVTSKGIEIGTSSEAGLFYALQTLDQMIATAGQTIPAVAIVDEPRFGWRGFMLDEGRHIFGKDEVKKVIDIMAAHKLNRFHWHLTEDQGWRIESKKYPKLTEVGAWRSSNRLGWKNTGWETDTTYYGGFYTQDDIKEIVQYARDRYIEVIPEIDIPGHTQAAVAAYPEILACDPQNPHEVWLSQGVSDDVMNVANPAAVQMAKDLIDELIELFPYPYLHLGGDECPTDKWEKNPQCRAQLAKLGSKDYRDLQLYFYRQLIDHLATKPADQQRNLIFWNEVLHGNTDIMGNQAPITIMAWVGADAAAKDAAERGLTTILSPQIPYYINRKQSELETEPMSQGRGTETVERVYSYVPLDGVPEELHDKYMGVQANFWSEYVDTPEVLEYLMLPRLAAVAEAAWTPQDKRQYDDFRNRVITLAPALYEPRGWNYATHIFPSVDELVAEQAVEGVAAD